MLNHLKTFWKAISTGWVIEYPERGEPPKDFFDRRDRRPMYVDSLPRYQDLYSFRRQGRSNQDDDMEVDHREDVVYEAQRQQEEEEEREDAVFRWSEQMRLKAEKERR
tara:strand:+ start:128 stop:451 length:324 start_codon:yes stop_codon:yes gene_type:complete